ncbi:MAG: bifunctional pyr operon transcriptional regulator/uracil phosphoribosyltransferase PyrR [Candidatus Dormibacteraeota bacterium]|nr:bifunctional pyr operon transcriptional regulator/uracil phosphoribosyltransferase PyrR [Candidatus Dormibacteraeota bacterium]
MDADAIRRSLSRIAHEIIERNRGVAGVTLVGILSQGDVLAQRLALKLAELEGTRVPVGRLDVSEHRDDLHLRPRCERGMSEVPDLNGRIVVLVDDVLYHGRTARAALDALLQFGRPSAVQLAVLVDRGHRELPIRADYVGKNVPTADSERVQVCLLETQGVDAAVILAG